MGKDKKDKQKARKGKDEPKRSSKDRADKGSKKSKKKDPATPDAHETDPFGEPNEEPKAPEVEPERFDPASEPGPTYDAPRTDAPPSRSLEENLWPTLCHLAPLVGWVFAFTGFGLILMPFLWIAAPLIVWQTQKSDPRVEENGREAVNFQLNVVGLSTVFFVTCVLSPFGLILPVAAIALSLYAALQTSEGRTYRYPLVYRLIRE